MELINYILSLTVIGEVFHPRSKLAGYSTENKLGKYKYKVRSNTVVGDQIEGGKVENIEGAALEKIQLTLVFSTDLTDS
jgi:hypothetical protein